MRTKYLDSLSDKSYWTVCISAMKLGKTMTKYYFEGKLDVKK